MTSKIDIKLLTYGCKLSVIITDSLRQESNKIFKKYNLVDEDPDGENEGLFITPNITKYFLLIDLQYLSHNTIAHEIYHGTIRVTEDRGITDEEAQAWLCGHITSEVYKFLDKKKFTIKHG